MLCDHIAIMDLGKVIAQGSHDELVKIVGELDRIDLTINAESEQVMEQWRAAEGVHQVSAEDSQLTLLVDDRQGHVWARQAMVVANGFAVYLPLVPKR